MDLKNANPFYLTQLGLKLEGVEEDPAHTGKDAGTFGVAPKSGAPAQDDIPSPEEARRRSEAARLVLEWVIGGGRPPTQGEGIGWKDPTHGDPQKAGSPDPSRVLRDQDDRPAWFETYQQLRALHFPWRMACYIAWAASPRQGRWPKNQDELARQVLGLTTDRVIGTWRQKNPEIDEAIGLIQAQSLLDHRADVLKALADSASKPDHRSKPDRQLFLEMTGDYVPRTKVDLGGGLKVDDLSGLPEEELEKMARLGRGDKE